MFTLSLRTEPSSAAFKEKLDMLWKNGDDYKEHAH
jgi:hypothetical protein